MFNPKPIPFYLIFGYTHQTHLRSSIEMHAFCIWYNPILRIKGEFKWEVGNLETTLETHGFYLSRSKTEYTKCKFNNRRSTSNLEVKVEDHIIPQVTWFKYLGCVIQNDGEIEWDINHRIKARWRKWRRTLGFYMTQRYHSSWSKFFLSNCVKTCDVYETECWTLIIYTRIK